MAHTTEDLEHAARQGVMYATGIGYGYAFRAGLLAGGTDDDALRAAFIAEFPSHAGSAGVFVSRFRSTLRDLDSLRGVSFAPKYRARRGGRRS